MEDPYQRYIAQRPSLIAAIAYHESFDLDTEWNGNEVYAAKDHEHLKPLKVEKLAFSPRKQVMKKDVIHVSEIVNQLFQQTLQWFNSFYKLALHNHLCHHFDIENFAQQGCY